MERTNQKHILSVTEFETKESEKPVKKFSKPSVSIYPFALVAIAGIVVGCVVCALGLGSNDPLPAFLGRTFLDLKGSGNFFQILYHSFLPLFLIFLACFFIGTSAAGRALLFFLPFINGSTSGFVLTYIYSAHTGGLLYTIFLYIPVVVLTSAAVILASRETFRLSTRVFEVVFKGADSGGIQRGIKEFIVKLTFLLAVTLLLSALDAMLHCMFFDWFKIT